MGDNVLPFRRPPKDEGEEQPGNVATVIEDLEVAHGHVVEATAEAKAVEPTPVELVDALYVADAAVAKALRAAHKAKP